MEYYDPDKPIVVVSDACTYGLGGVIAHVVGKEERPISFTSFSLNDAQKSYPILHLEALAVVSTIKKFHKYLYGKKFTVYTDHKPLIGIFGKEGRNSIFVTRLQRYIMELAIYDFDIVYRPSAKMGNADFCSRFPLPNEVPRDLQRDCVKNINITGELPLDYTVIAKETLRDEFLQQILSFLRNGWPKKMNRQFRDVYSNHQDLEVVDSCLLFQDRVVIPMKLQGSVLKLLHRNHAGITKIKQLARRSVYWYGMNGDIEDFVKACCVCSQMAVSTKKPLQSSWIPTSRPFSRIHADFFYFQQKVFLVIVDSYSRWLEVEFMRYGTDAKKVKGKFLSLFARFGLPDVIVTDGGPPFNSRYLIDFLEQQGIKVMKSPPYHPASNGQAERMVRVTKEVLKKFLLDPEMKDLDIEDQISCFLFNYRNTCTEDSRFPSEKLLTFKPKTILDLVNPKNSFRRHLTTQSDEEGVSFRNDVGVDKSVQDEFAKLRTGDPIYYKNFRPTDVKRWLDAVFLKRLSPNVFQVSVGGRTYTAHREQLKFKVKRPILSVCDWKQSRKRPREEEADDSDDLDNSDVYGYVVDSFLFDPQTQVDSSLPLQSTSGSSLLSNNPVSTSVDHHPQPSTSTTRSSKVVNSNSNGTRSLLSRKSNDQQSSNSEVDQPQEDIQHEVVDHRKDSRPRRSRRTKRIKKDSQYLYY